MATPNEIDAKQLYERMCFVQLETSETKWPAIQFSSYRKLFESITDQKLKSLLFLNSIRCPLKEGETLALLLGKPPTKTYSKVITNNTEEIFEYTQTFSEYNERLEDLEGDLQNALNSSLEMFEENVATHIQGDVIEVTLAPETSAQNPIPQSKKKNKKDKKKDMKKDTKKDMKKDTKKYMKKDMKKSMKKEMKNDIAKDAEEESENSSEIMRYDSWKIVWQKLQNKGWSWDHTPASNLKSERIYIFPGGSKKGVDGKDYFSHVKSLKIYVRETFEWKGEPAPSPIEPSGRRSRAPSTKMNTIFEERVSRSKKSKKALIGKHDRQERPKNKRARSESIEESDNYLGLPLCEASPTPETRKRVKSKVSHLELVDDSSLESHMSGSDHISLDSNYQPHFDQVWEILCSKLNFEKREGCFMLPNITGDSAEEHKGVFSSESDLQKFLVKFGIPGNRDAINGMERSILMLWLSLAHMPSPARDLPLLATSKVWGILSRRGFRYINSLDLLPAMYVLPNVQIPQNILEAQTLQGKVWVEKTHQFKELFCRYGVPGEDDDQKYQLAKWAAQDCSFEIFAIDDEASKGSRGKRRRSRENKEWEQMKSTVKSLAHKTLERPSHGKPIEISMKKPKKSTVASTIVTDAITDVSSVTHTIATFKSTRSQKSRESQKSEPLHLPEETIADRDAFEILRKYFNFKSQGSMYVLPNVQAKDRNEEINTFNSLRSLRLYLLQNRIPTTSKGLAALEEEKQTELSRWLACAHVPRGARAVRAVFDREAWKLLKKRGFYAAGECYALPGTKIGGEMSRLRTKNIDWFERLAPGGIQEWCCVNGIPPILGHEEGGDIEDIELANWASSCILNAFNIIDVDSSERSCRTPRSSVSSSYSPKRAEKKNRRKKKLINDVNMTTIEEQVHSEENDKPSQPNISTNLMTQVDNDQSSQPNISTNFMTQVDNDQSSQPNISTNYLTQVDNDISDEGSTSDPLNEMNFMTQAEVRSDDEESRSNSINESMELEAEIDPDLSEQYKLNENKEHVPKAKNVPNTPDRSNKVEKSEQIEAQTNFSTSNDSDQVESSFHENETHVSNNSMGIDDDLPDEETVSEREHLDTCLSRLHLTFETNAGESVFRRDQTEEARIFVEEALRTIGYTDCSGKSTGQILHLCGAPGTGKTTAARRCISEISAHSESLIQNKDSTLHTFFEIINCSHLQTATNIQLKEHFCSVIGKGLNMPQQSNFEAIEKRLDVTNPSKLIVLVLDEIDLLMSLSGATTVLDTLFRWSLSSNHTFTLVGISNVVEMKWMTKFSHIEKLQENITKVVFPPYGKDDLIKIVQKRVGTCTFDHNSLELAGRKIAAASGDARAMLNLAAGAVRKYQEMFQTSHEYNQINPSTMEPLIKLKHMMKAVRESVGKKQTDHIESLPQAAKMVLCVAVTLGHCLGTTCEMPVHRLKKYVSSATRNGMFENLSNEHFTEVLDLLIDSGLLLMGGDYRFVDEASERMIKLGVQLDDVECALETTLFQQSFYKNLKEHLEDEVRSGRL